MGESLPHCSIKKLLFFSALLFGMVQGAYSQSLGPGDVAFTGLNGSEETLPFKGQAFDVVSTPKLAFTSNSLSVNEAGTSIDLTVELLESNNSPVNVDVVFMASSSTVNASDIGGFSSKTVSFSASDTPGTKKTITIPLNDDADFEGVEKAVFQLQNNTAGSIISPSELTLSIEDDDTPDIVINEILFDPEGDANGDGITDTSDDEFVELVNNSNQDIDVSGWQLFSGPGDEFIFPSGSVIPANKAFVVFSGTSEVNSNFGGALIYTGSSLGLNNESDNVILKDASGTIIVGHSYSGGGNNQSITRNPDITGSFTDHTDASNASFSPGTKVDGTPFGSKHAIAFRGGEGWRMISSPIQSASFNDFFGNFRIQGVAGKDNSSESGTLFSWTESGGGTYSVPSNMNETMAPGLGYIVYLFEDDEYNVSGIQGGFPKVVSSNGTENSGTVDVTITAEDADGSGSIDGNEGWNLLGNPYGTFLSVTEVIGALESANPNVQASLHVWNHQAGGGNGAFETLTDGDLLAPFQAFFVKYTTAGVSASMTFDKSTMEADEEDEFNGNIAEDAFELDIELHGNQFFDTYSVEFNDKGSIDLDRYDAYKLFSLNTNSINLFSTLSNNRLQKNVLPRYMESKLEIPLSFIADDQESLTFKWDNSKQLPSGWRFTLMDKEMNREIDMRINNEYQFNRTITGQQDLSPEKSLLNKTSGEDQEARFVLSIEPKQAQIGSPELPESVKLNPNYPNPFNPQTTIPYELAEEAEVKLTVWNMIGQKVATLVDGLVEAGQHEETWNASSMPSGMYIARFEVGGEVFIRKMTLIK